MSKRLNNMPKITQPGSGTAGIGTWECDSQAHQTLPCGTPPSVSSLRGPPQDPLPAAEGGNAVLLPCGNLVDERPEPFHVQDNDMHSSELE